MTITMETPGLLERIESRLIRPRPDCLIWTGAVDRGYGRVYVDGRAARVHRVVWELTHGPIPDDLTIDHLCRVRGCCNVEHMELVTAVENVRRGNGADLRLGGHCSKDHQIESDADLYFKPGGKGVRCRECMRAQGKRRRARERPQTAGPPGG